MGAAMEYILLVAASGGARDTRRQIPRWRHLERRCAQGTTTGSQAFGDATCTGCLGSYGHPSGGGAPSGSTTGCSA
eukprot:7263101-Prymnesium_polylepis.2